tara:strand:+ start:154 stop:1278 length:1125 start_codon:yes stop_codon:yes gene_type:complete
MGKERFRETDGNSFFGSFVYDRVVPKDHFLRKLNEVVNWQVFSWRLAQYYKGGAEYGPIPYDPTLILKMLLVSYLYDISERQTEELCNDSLSVKCFLGLAADERAPDHATLSLFKNRLVKREGEESFRKLFQELLRTAQENGIKFGGIQVVDSTHTIADVNVAKDEKRQEKEGKEPRDPNASWGVKGSKKVKDEEGKEREQKEYFYGYKTHLSINAETRLITSLEVTTGSAYDGHQLPGLVEQDLAQGVGAKVYAGDRGYDDGENHLYLKYKKLKSALRLNDYRTQKKDSNKEPWLKLLADPDYKAGLKERYKVEPKFGEGKNQHGLRRSRYIGLVGNGVQSYLTAMVLNLKRMVKLLYGVSFRNQSYPVLKAA